MTEHEQLKEICDTIGFNKINKFWNNDGYYVTTLFGFRKYNVREIIFTQEFMDKFENKLMEIFRPNTINVKTMMSGLLYHLDNPTQYLYNLLGLGKQENN